ncbi:tetratricopeptide repeat protein [Curvibacter sp. RS43]|uniref:tetratricopeptide repeat protein n=1 Tax=Curvibacter microcysteis TaxID=3026419 RepID=UPI002360B2EF|nr:tetratricopeptide repeat protein [Curvibacter sp. RS43]MDD0810440.1 tetratricopeptide repeat protein [Curvibacter sp. RS43]
MLPFLRLGPVAIAVLMTLSGSVLAQTPPPEAEPESKVVNSSLDAQLFYEILLGEMNAKGNEAATGFALLLDSARRTNDARLFQRAMEVALQARSGESALQAAQNWRLAQPDSREANRYVLQILIALNRINDTAEPLQRELAMTPLAQKPQALATIVQIYSRVGDRAQAARLVEEALAKELVDPAVGVDAWMVVGQMRLAAGRKPLALDAARKALMLKPGAEAPIRLALELMDPQLPAAEAMIKQYLSTYARPDLRTAYARALISDQRYAEAQQQLEKATHDRADLPEAWLILGALQAEQNQQAAGQRSLERYLKLVAQQPEDEARQRGESQAYLSLALLAEKRQDTEAAQGWLNKVSSPALQATTKARQASILAQQGRVEEGLKLLQSLPTSTPAEARSRLMAEVQLLRGQKQFEAAFQLLDKALVDFPDDADLLYDQAMLADKLQRYDVMEKLLRTIIEQQPDNQNAYNALGYSFAERGVRLPEARELVNKALSLAPNDPFISDSLAWVEFKAGNLNEAIRILEKAFRSKPDPEIAAHLGEVLWVAGQKSRAQSVWKEGLALSKDNESLLETLRRFNVKP